LTCAGKARRSKGPDVKTCGRCGAVFSATRCPERRGHPKLSKPELTAVRADAAKKVWAARSPQERAARADAAKKVFVVMTPQERKMHWRSRDRVRTFADFDDMTSVPDYCYDVPDGLPQETEPND
jgi:hypothetical protein